MSDESAKRQVAEFLDEKAFQPVLRAKPDDYPPNKRDKLKHVQRATESERKRYHGYYSAKKFVQMFHDDLSSDAAKKVDRELKDLRLPTLDDIRDQFDRRARTRGPVLIARPSAGGRTLQP
jgi:hypothetical protein